MTSLRPRTRRLLALTGGAAVVGVVLAGCSATNPMTTENQYSASDGVRFVLGDVRGSNLLVLSEGKGEVGRLEGALVNDGDEDQVVTLTFGDAEPTTVPLGPKETVLLDGSDEDGHVDVVITAVEVEPGAVAPLTVRTGSGGSTTLDVPVLDGSLPEYSSAVPTQLPTTSATPTPTPSASS
ncbi:hypothetical protein [Cellulomonas sp. URHB0016]